MGGRPRLPARRDVVADRRGRALTPGDFSGLTWPGKAAARALADAPAYGVLEPLPGSPDDAEHLFVEGDNLPVLQALREDLAGQVSLMYLDPPYNTGGTGFVYDDDFAGHDGWLSMVYPRLLVARDLLADDGVGFVSIDDHEMARLRLLLEEVFGPANVLGTIVWVNNLKGRQIGDGGPVGTHEYVLCFAKEAGRVRQFRGVASELQRLMPTVYRSAPYLVRHDEHGPYVTKNWLRNSNSKFNERTAPTLVYRIHYHPGTGDVQVSDVDHPADDPAYAGYLTAMPHPNARPGLRWHAWRWSRSKVLAQHHDLEFDTSGPDLRIRTKVRDVSGTAMKDLVIGPSTVTGQADLAALGLGRLFETPKPVALVDLLLSVTDRPDALVLDFFAGSGTTGEAVLRCNARDGGHRRFVLVQSPEPCRAGSAAAEAGYATVADLGRERVRRAAALLDGSGSSGFRSLRWVERPPGEHRQEGHPSG